MLSGVAAGAVLNALQDVANPGTGPGQQTMSTSQIENQHSEEGSRESFNAAF